MKSEMWKNEINLDAWVLVGCAPFGPLADWALPLASVLDDWANLEPRKDLAFGAPVVVLPLVLVPFGKLASSSWQMNISSQCSSFRIESYVTHKAGP